MIVASKNLHEFLTPDSTVELRMRDGKLASSCLPYLEAWTLIERGEVEGKVRGKRLRYLRLLSPEEVKARRQLKRESRPEDFEGGGCQMPSHLTMGVRRQKLKEVIVGTDVFGNRTVIGEGEVIGWCYQFHGSSI